MCMGVVTVTVRKGEVMCNIMRGVRECSVERVE